MRGVLLTCALFVSLGTSVRADPPPGPIDPELHDWFEHLHQPGSKLLCCSISDCHFTSYEWRDGAYQVTIDGFPYRVPDAAVLRSTSNITGRAVVCYGYSSFNPPGAANATTPQDTIDIMCFIPDKPVS